MDMTFYVLVILTLLASLKHTSTAKERTVELFITISAVTNNLQISWKNANIISNDWILVTNKKPALFLLKSVESFYESASEEGFTAVTCNGNDTAQVNENLLTRNCSDEVEIVFAVKPKVKSNWLTTNVTFDYTIGELVDKSTKCYGYWVSYVNEHGDIESMKCIEAFPTWMNDLRSKIEDFRFRDLMIPGTHDSASYIPGFDHKSRETLITKYSITQDENIKSQLLHGIRYLDIRVGYYRSTPEQFWANHGISKMIPLETVIEQVKDFVKETNEIVLFDIQEFPVGFGKTLEIHEKFVEFLREKFEDVLVDPKLSWQAKLREIWHRGKNVVLCYDFDPIVERYPDVFFTSVEQKWGDVQSWDDLERYLVRANQQSILNSSGRPVADMAEITPDAWGVIIDRYGGLRKLADGTNHFVSLLYRYELGHNTNIVAVDFFRGTTIVETAIYYNSKKVVR